MNLKKNDAERPENYRLARTLSTLYRAFSTLLFTKGFTAHSTDTKPLTREGFDVDHLVTYR